MAVVWAVATAAAVAMAEGMAVAMAVTVAESVAVALAVAMAVVMPVDVVPLPSPRPQASCHRYLATATSFSVGERNLSMIHVEKRVSVFFIEKRSVLILYIGNAGSLLSRKGVSLFSVLRMRGSLLYKERRVLSILYRGEYGCGLGCDYDSGCGDG